MGDRLPVALREAAVGRFTGSHLGVLAALVAGLLCVAAWWALAGRPQVQPVAPLAPVADGPATSGTGALSTAAATSGPPGAPGTGTADATGTTGPSPAGAAVIVDVTGRVRRPGIVTLPQGSRVADALDAAGGARPGVDLTTLNLARQLVDGEQLLVGVRPAAVPGAPATAPPSGLPSSGALVNLNTATAEQLDTLPGVGPVTAQAILDWRTQNGSFTSVDELLEVDGIGDATLADLRDLVTV
ncbi:MAG: ComEA family DNA-binding protein [Nocardioidaceae bacterium]